MRADAASAANSNVRRPPEDQARQLYNGALTLWDGEGTEHGWSSIYAAHFLIEAQKAGFEWIDRCGRYYGL